VSGSIFVLCFQCCDVYRILDQIAIFFRKALRTDVIQQGFPLHRHFILSTIHLVNEIRQKSTIQLSRLWIGEILINKLRRVRSCYEVIQLLLTYSQTNFLDFGIDKAFGNELIPYLLNGKITYLSGFATSHLLLIHHRHLIDLLVKCSVVNTLTVYATYFILSLRPERCAGLDNISQ